MRDVDLLALGVIKSIHGVDAGQHGEAPEAHEGEEEGEDDAEEKTDRHQVLAVPRRTEVVLQVKGLQLDVWQRDTNPGEKVWSNLKLLKTMNQVGDCSLRLFNHSDGLTMSILKR